MATKQFDSLLNEYLSQLTEAPVYFEGDPDELIKQLAAAKIKYFVKNVEDQLNISSEQIWNDMVKEFNFVEELFPAGVNPSNNEDAFRRSIVNVLLKTVPKLEKKYEQTLRVGDLVKNLKNVGGTQAGYSSRGISDTSMFRKEFDRMATKEKDVEGAKPKVSKVEAPKAFRSSSKVDYTFEPDVKAGTLSEEELRVYGAVDHGQSYTGNELLDFLKSEVKLEPREDLNTSKISRILTSLMSKGVLTSNVKASEEGDVEALGMFAQGPIDLEREAPNEIEAYKEYIRNLDMD